MAYKNPIPSLDDEDVSKKYYISFTFNEYVSHDDAVKGINDLIKQNGGTIPREWIRMGEPSHLRLSDSANNNINPTGKNRKDHI